MRHPVGTDNGGNHRFFVQHRARASCVLVRPRFSASSESRSTISLSASLFVPYLFARWYRFHSVPCFHSMPVTNARQPADCTESGRRTYPSQGHHFPLFFALYQVVEGLHGDERCPAMPFRDMLCFLELPDPHCRNPDVAGLARQSAAVGATPHDAMHLGGDDNLVPPGKILDGASQNFLASAEAVDIGRIKEIDAQIQRSL